jgi:hypothetical protein
VAGLDLEPACSHWAERIAHRPATYQTLVGEYGWPQQRWRTWCAAAIAEQLFATETHRLPTR